MGAKWALFTRAHEYLAITGREPQPVEAKIVISLPQAATLELDETLAQKWAALLANATDPAQRAAVQPAFTEVLRQLTTIDATVVDWFYKQAPAQIVEALAYTLPEVEMR